MIVTRKGGGAICRLCRTTVERGSYAGYGVPAMTGHRSVPPVTVTRKGKGAICRLCRTSMEAMLYGYRINTEGERGPYTGYAVRAWKQYHTGIEAIPYKHKGYIVQA